MPTTTIKLIREQQQTLVNALTPASHSGVKFRDYSDQQPFEDWAEATPQGCLRRYAIKDLFSYEDVAVSDMSSEDIRTSLELVIAYPRDARYGLQNEEHMRDVIREDMHQIDTAIGARGYGDYVSGQSGCWMREPELEEGEAVWFLRTPLEILFRRAF